MTSQPSENKELSSVDTKKAPKRKRKTLIILLCCFLSLVIVAASTGAALWYFGKSGMTEKDATLAPTDGVDTTVNDDDTVVYKDKVYKYNEKIAAILCIGVDDEKKMSGGVAVTGHAGQADALYLIAVDTESGKTTVLGIPRDTLVDVDIYSKSGSYAGVENTQICLAYAYGDGQKTSCENTVKSVSRLLYGMPVNSYFAVDQKAIASLHGAVGTVTVIPNETLNTGSVSFKEGVEFRLTKYNVFDYLQARNQKSVDASYKRMQRQLDYIKKYSAAAIEKTKKNILFPVELYNKIQKKAVTNMDASRITYLTSAIISTKESASLEFISMTGEQIKGEDGYAEFYPDEEALFETVLSIYYKEVK